MGQAVGNTLPLALGIVISPLPIAAVVLLLGTPRGRTKGWAFLFGWILGLAAVGTAVLLVAGSSRASEGGAAATWSSWVKLLAGVGLLVVAYREFAQRPRGSVEPEMPRWMTRLDSTSPAGACGLGLVLVVANPKELLLAAGGALAIAQTGIAGWQQVVAYLVFALVATAGVVTPLVIEAALGRRADTLLGRMRTWLGANNAVIMTVLCAVIGVKLIGDAIGALGG